MDLGKRFVPSLELYAELDKYEPSPSVLANKFSEVLAKYKEELTDYDITCFSLLWLSAQALTNLEFVKPEIKDLCRLVYYNHYWRVWKKVIQSQSIVQPNTIQAENINSPPLLEEMPKESTLTGPLEDLSFGVVLDPADHLLEDQK